MAFKVSEVTPEETYDFEQYGPSGVIPEPSYEKISQFRKVFGTLMEGIKETLGAATDIEKLPAAEQLAMVSQFLERDDSAEQKAILQAMSDLTEIDFGVLAALPFRVQQAFMGHLVGVFLRPGSTSAIGAL